MILGRGYGSALVAVRASCFFFSHRSWLLTSVSYLSHLSFSRVPYSDVGGLLPAFQVAAALSQIGRAHV